MFEDVIQLLSGTLESHEALRKVLTDPKVVEKTWRPGKEHA